MNVRYVVYLLIMSMVVASCDKITMSKVPEIELMSFSPGAVKVNFDTAFLRFKLQDGDANLGNPKNSGKYDIYIKDFRFDTGYTGYHFPDINPSIEEAGKGVKGVCEFQFTPFLLSPRLDSLHMTLGDTTHFEVYIVDKEGNESNHITTSSVIMYF